MELCFHQGCPGHLCSGFLATAAVWYQSDTDELGFAAEVCLSGLLEIAWGYPWLKWIHMHSTGCSFAILTFLLLKFSRTLHTGSKRIEGTHRYSSPSQHCALHGVTQGSFFKYHLWQAQFSVFNLSLYAGCHRSCKNTWWGKWTTQKEYNPRQWGYKMLSTVMGQDAIKPDFIYWIQWLALPLAFHTR